jgi:hypothetical protein
MARYICAYYIVIKGQNRPKTTSLGENQQVLMGDILLTALKAFNRDSQRGGLFMKILSAAPVYAFVPNEVLEAGQGPKPERLTVIREAVNGQLESYVPFFSDESRARLTLEMFLSKKENSERRVSVTALNGADFFLSRRP